MANSAFAHEAAIIMPSSSTNTGIVTWSGTGANNFLDSTVLVSGNNITIPGTITFGGTQITSTAAELNLLNGVSGLVQADFTKLAAIDSTAAEVNLLDAITRGSIIYGNASGATALLGKGTNGQVLTSNATDVLWADAAGGGVDTTGTPANNQVATFTDTDTLQGEAGLTYNGTSMLVALAGSPPTPDHVSMHIWEGDAGNVTASTDTQFIVEHSGNAGITVLSPATATGQIAFGSTTDNRQGGIVYNHDQNCMYLRTGNADRMRIIGSTGQVFINESTNAGDGDGTCEPMFTVKMKASTSTGEIMGLKHPSHSQTITTYAEADTFMLIRRAGVYGQIGMMGMNGKTGGQIMATCTQPHYSTNSSQYGVFRVMVATGSGNGQGSSTASLSAYNGETNNNMVTFDDNTSTRFIFQAQGRGFADDDWTTYSDGRLKSNQEVVPYGLAEVLQLQPKVYDRDSGYIDENTKEIVLEGNIRRQIGFVAQEVRAIIPEVVEEVDELSWYSLTDGKLMAVVVKAIQELKAEVDALKG